MSLGGDRFFIREDDGALREVDSRRVHRLTPKELAAREDMEQMLAPTLRAIESELRVGAEAARQRWLDYLAERTGTYHLRARRYAHVAVWLDQLGLCDGDLILDVGAGYCEFGKYLYGSGWTGRYLPVDGAIDGTDLDRWTPAASADFIVAIETVEHLENPGRFFDVCEACATRGAVITTPNPDVVDVLSLDPTHRNEIRREDLEGRGWIVHEAPLFGKNGDTLVGVYTPRGDA